MIIIPIPRIAKILYLFSLRIDSTNRWIFKTYIKEPLRKVNDQFCLLAVFSFLHYAIL